MADVKAIVCKTGEQVTILDSAHGGHYCRKSNGSESFYNIGEIIITSINGLRINEEIVKRAWPAVYRN